MTQLRIGVRTVGEASSCIHNGADRIEVEGPPGSSIPSPAVVRAILREIPPRFRAGASLGDLVDWRRSGRFPEIPFGLSSVRIGLAGCASLEGWREELGRFRREVLARAEILDDPDWAIVASVEGPAAGSPGPEEVLDFAAANGFPSVLLDIRRDAVGGFFDQLGPVAAGRLVRRARALGVELVLASLLPAEADRARAIDAEAILIGAGARTGGRSDGAIEPALVRSLALRLAGAVTRIAATG